MQLKNKHILLGITGSIAAYKIPELIRLLQKEGASVQVMVTQAALQFVTSTTLESISGYSVLQNFSSSQNFSETKTMVHLQATRKADLVLIAPATADILAKFAHGYADDFVSTTILGSSSPVLVVPAMNVQMWKNSLVQNNVKKLRKVYSVLDPEEGFLACGEYGVGRLPDMRIILEHVIKILTPQDLKGKKVLIAAGSTREYFDPVRFLSNVSSGKMAFALAQEAYRRGASVSIIKGFTEISFDMLSGLGIKIFPIISAQEMFRQTLALLSGNDVLLCPAAIADYCPSKISSIKIKRNSKFFKPEFILNSDLLQTVAGLKKRPFTVGFALEQSLQIKLGHEKFKKKMLDMLVLNDFKTLQSDEVRAVLFEKKGINKTSLMSKESLSQTIFDQIVKSF